MSDSLWARVFARLIRAPSWSDAKCMIIAVSGGADSLATLHLLKTNLAQTSLSALYVAHMNHCLRGPDSEADAAFVREIARSWKLPAIIQRIDVGVIARAEKKNVEAVARRERYAFLYRLAQALDVSLVVTGHTMTDQAETVLLRLLRGTGVDGLAGIQSARKLSPAGRTPVHVIRPLLDVSRAEVRKYVQRYDVSFREDASNEDDSFSRNRLRHQAFPALQSVNPKASAALSRIAERADEDARYFAEIVAQWLAVHAIVTDDQIQLPAAELAGLGKAVQRRILHNVAQRPEFPAVGSYHISQIADVLLAPGAQGKRVILPGGREVRRVGRHLIFQMRRKSELA